jgi:adenylyltransferase and sulfurtransferase
MNPYPSINAYITPITPSNALSLLKHHTLILDCTDRPSTRYLISDASIRLSIPLISGAAIGHGGQWSIYGGLKKKDGKRRACYRCLWPKPLPRKEGEGTCEEEGVWGAVTGLVGTGMASEAIKMIVGMEGESREIVSRVLCWYGFMRKLTTESLLLQMKTINSL